MGNSVLFSRVMEEYGNLEKEKEEEEKTKDEEKIGDGKKKAGKKVGLMQEEERLTGSVAGSVYTKYFRFAGGVVRMPIILVLLTLYQGSNGTSARLSAL